MVQYHPYHQIINIVPAVLAQEEYKSSKQCHTDGVRLAQARDIQRCPTEPMEVPPPVQIAQKLVLDTRSPKDTCIHAHTHSHTHKCT